MQFVAQNASVEVNGETVRSVIDGMGTMSALALRQLKKVGIEDPQAGRWYPQQAWLNAFKEIAENIGANTLFKIGQAIPRNAQFPKEIDSVPKALGALDVAFHMNHRLKGELLFAPATGVMKEGIGHIAFTSTGPRSGTIVSSNPYPCDFDRGLIEAMVKRFKPVDGAALTVKHDGPCRAKGADTCTYLVSW